MKLLKLVEAALRPHEDRADIALELFEQGDLVKVPMPGKQIWFTKSPAHFRHVLADNAANYVKSYDYRILAELTGDGLIASEGEVWKRDRRLMQPLFHQAMLTHFVSRITSVAKKTVDSWEGREAVCISDEMTALGITVIGHRVLGEDVSAHAPRIAELISSSQRWLIERGAAPVDVAKYVRTPGRRAFERGLTELDGMLEPVIARRLAVDDGFDLVSVLAQSGASRQALRDHVRTFFAAGYETTAVALTWICWLLGRNPQWQERVAAELKRELGDRDPRFDDLRRLPLLRAVIEESLRLYPAVPLVGREALADDTLDGVRIPKGATLVLCFLAAHRDARHWAEPLKFDPERFLGGPTVPWAHLPFGAGPRACIGAQFAMMEMSIVLATVLRRFRLAPTHGPEVKPVPLVSLRPSRPVHLKLARAA